LKRRGSGPAPAFWDLSACDAGSKGNMAKVILELIEPTEPMERIELIELLLETRAVYAAHRQLEKGGTK
jgi:hypothetical protein